MEGGGGGTSDRRGRFSESGDAACAVRFLKKKDMFAEEKSVYYCNWASSPTRRKPLICTLASPSSG